MAKRKEKESENCCDHKHHWHHKHACGGGYFLAFVGVAVYYVQQSTTFWEGVLGVLKALVWPAILTYNIFHILGL